MSDQRRLTEDEIKRLANTGIEYPWHPLQSLHLLDRIAELEAERDLRDEHIGRLKAENERLTRDLESKKDRVERALLERDYALVRIAEIEQRARGAGLAAEIGVAQEIYIYVPFRSYDVRFRFDDPENDTARDLLEKIAEHVVDSAEGLVLLARDGKEVRPDEIFQDFCDRGPFRLHLARETETESE